jgi:hypothetical protein
MDVLGYLTVEGRNDAIVEAVTPLSGEEEKPA